MTLLDPTDPTGPAARRAHLVHGDARAGGQGERREASPDPRDARRWADLAHGVGLDPSAPVLLALSGGADSVFLLHVLAAARPRADVVAVHVEHGLRGVHALDDAAFCRSLADDLGVPLVVEAAVLPRGASQEACAREARYRALARFAGATGRVVLTAHHADDALETLLLRWTRGSAAPGLRPPRTRGPLPYGTAELGPAGEPLRVARPLARLRGAEVRRALRERDLSWREDASNADPAHTRNRVRAGLLPLLAEHGGPDALDGLFAFADAVEGLEQELAQRTAHFAWEPLDGVEPTPGRPPGGWLRRAELAALPTALRRRVLWRLLVEVIGTAPGRGLVEALVDDVGSGRLARRSLPGGAELHLRSDQLVLTFPSRPRSSGSPQTPAPGREGALLRAEQPLELPDGRRVVLRRASPREAEERAPALQLAAEAVVGPLRLRRARAGDRFQALGAPGSKRLVRFLADRGVPRDARGLAWVVEDAGTQRLLGVLGHGPAETARLRPGTHQAWRLEELAPPRAPGVVPGLEPRPDARRAPGRRGRDTGAG